MVEKDDQKVRCLISTNFWTLKFGGGRSVGRSAGRSVGQSGSGRSRSVGSW